MKFIDYLKDKIFDLIINILTLIFINVSLIFFNVSKTFIICVTLIYLSGILIIFIHDYSKRKKFYNFLNRKLDELDQKYLITEVLERPTFVEGNILIDALYEIDKNYNEELNKYKLTYEEFKDYIELWCHEIKTPIATTNLIIANNKNNITDNISEEINNVEYFIEQVLFYARSGTLEKDYLIKEVNLSDITKQIIKDNKKALLAKNIKIKNFDETIIVKSDAKWLIFIINQIVNNSIKYSKDKDPIIEFSWEQNKNNISLSIKDNGIGISDTDITKVFEKGFTGYNGRKKYNSTGIGLYLCKKLCNKLGHNIIISSIENKETIVTIIFPINSMTNI